MKTILMLDTSAASLNMGDEIINISIKNNFPEIFAGNYIVNLPTHTPLYNGYQILLYPKKMGVYKDADFKFLCGTNALYKNMMKPLPSWNINLFNTKLVRGTICLGVGIGENSKNINWYTELLYNKVLSKKYVHSVRDEKSKRFLEIMGYKAMNTGCPTLWGLNSEHCSKIFQGKSDSVVFTLTGYQANPAKDKRMIEILRKNYTKLYFWPQSIDDFKYLRTIGEQANVNIVTPSVHDYGLLLDTQIDYIGNRLHGGIYALQHFCRTIIIAIDYRAEEMKKSYSIPCIHREDIDKQLDSLINSQWKTSIMGLDFDKIAKWKSQFE